MLLLIIASGRSDYTVGDLRAWPEARGKQALYEQWMMNRPLV
jgi:hypothetical protein